MVELLEGSKPIGSKCVFRTKRVSNNQLKRYKARLFAKVFSWKEGIDYIKTFSSMSTKDSFRIIMVIVAYYDQELHKMDVKISFLNGDLFEDVYMV